MRPFRNFFVVAPLFTLLAGCHNGSATVTVRTPDPPERVIVEDLTSPPAFEVVADVESYDVSLVLYREYYECTDEEIRFIPYYRRYYVVDDCDLFFLFTVARGAHQPIDTVIQTYYYDCGRDYDRLVVWYGVDRAIFFVELPGPYRPDGPYARPYRLYRAHDVATARFTNLEFRVLVTLKIAVEYQEAPPELVVRRVRESSEAPQRAILRSSEMLGQGGRNFHGQSITVRHPRPWMLPEQESQRYRQEERRKAARSENAFQEKHGQRVKETHKGETNPDQVPQAAEPENEREHPKDVERAKEIERQKEPPKETKQPREPKK